MLNFSLKPATELTEAKEKVAKADSSSSESEDEATPKRKKHINNTDRPSEEVSIVESIGFF